MSTDKQLATLTAQCALAGVVLTVTTDDREKPMYVASRWALTRIFNSLGEVRSWLSHVTGKPVADAEFETNSMHRILIGEVPQSTVRH